MNEYYEKRMGFDKVLSGDTKYLEDKKSQMVQAALDRAHTLLRMEVDIYWRRTGYFWAIQAAIIVAIGVLGSAEDRYPQSVHNLILLMLSCVGFFVSVAWFLANRDSASTQENWQNHIFFLEDGIEGNLYKTILFNSGGQKNYNLVYNLNSSVSYIFVAAWFLLPYITYLIYRVENPESPLPFNHTIIVIYILVIIAFLFMTSVVVYSCFCKSNLKKFKSKDIETNTGDVTMILRDELKNDEVEKTKPQTTSPPR